VRVIDHRLKFGTLVIFFIKRRERLIIYERALIICNIIQKELRSQPIAGVCECRRVRAHPEIEYLRLIVPLCLSISLPLQILNYGIFYPCIPSLTRLLVLDFLDCVSVEILRQHHLAAYV
jgi:hypothetical protein